MPDVLKAIWEQRGQAPGPRQGSDDTLRATARLIATDTATYTATVSIWGSDPIAGVPTTPAVYTGVDSVHVLVRGGRPVHVLGPATDAVLEEPVPEPAPDPTTKTITGKVITPTYSGTYRVNIGAWDRYNTSTYGGRSDVYQGTGARGPMRGLVTYGNQFTALGASVITRVRLTVASNGAGLGGSWSAVLQGSPHGSRPAGAPTSSGDTVSVTVAGFGSAGQRSYVDLSSAEREGFRTGSFRGLVLVGPDYGGAHGTAHPPSLVAVADYEVST